MKRLLLIDAVEFPPDQAIQPLHNVGSWFGDRFRGLDIEIGVVRASDPELESRAAEADGLIVSGSPRDAWEDEAIILRLIGLLHIAVSSGQAVLGVCFGHQLLARAFGGDVRRNPAGWEVGECEIALTPAGRQSPLFDNLPSSFQVIQSHQDAVLSLPAESVLLATNSHTAIQAFALGDRAFGVQFHPEMNGEILRALWAGRREQLRRAVGFDFDLALQSARETPDAARIFENFAALLRPSPTK